MCLSGQGSASPSFLTAHGYTVSISDMIGVRVYSDTRPRKWKIANLQKGLILIYEGLETVGAASGFGSPTLEYSNESYFSGSSQVYVRKRDTVTVIRKDFFMDKIKRNLLGKIALENKEARNTLDLVALPYRSYFRPLRVKELLVSLGTKTDFRVASYAGKVTVTYTIDQRTIHVKADFSCVRKHGLKKILLLNEQSSRFFPLYTDSSGLALKDRKIGQFAVVKAKSASITDLHGNFGFTVQHVANSVLRRGQEFIDNFLDWVGLDYEISPENLLFEYNVEIIC